MSRVRLVGVMVTPIVLVDDGDSLKPLQIEAVQVSAEDWPTYATGGFQEAMAQLQAEVEANSPPKPNRATRRAKKP